MNDEIIYFTPSMKRAEFERIVADFAKHLHQPEEQVKASYLFQPKRAIISQALTTTNNQIDFDPWKSPSGLNNPDEVKLDKNSWLYVTGIGLWIAQYDPTTGAQDWSYRSWSYVDTNVFNKAGEAAALRRVYNGLLSLNTSSDNRLRDFHTSQLLDAPMTQVYTPTAGAAIFGMFENGAAVREFQPHLIIDGSADNTFSLLLGAGPSTNIDGSSAGALRNRVKLVLDGYEVKGAANKGLVCSGAA